MKRIYLSPPHVGDVERKLLLAAFDSNWIAPVGPDLDGLEREMCDRIGCHAAVALSSGTAALHLALLNLGVGVGDEVFVSTLTFVASANVVRYVGARPTFIDADQHTWNISPELLDEALETRARTGCLPKAVIVVDLYGQCADYDRLLKSCSQYDVPVIEDAAEALGASYRGRAAGTLGALGVFSFNGNKIMTTSGGGMLVSDNERWIERARYWSTQARQPAAHYEHTEIGYNFRLSNLLAAIGRGQLRTLDARIARRRQVDAYYREHLGDVPGISFMPRASTGEPNYWLTCVTIDAHEFGVDRNAICEQLEAKNIEARPLWKPMHLQPAYRDCCVFGGGLSAQLFSTGLCLPSGSSLSDDDLARVVRAVLASQRSRCSKG